MTTDNTETATTLAELCNLLGYVVERIDAINAGMGTDTRLVRAKLDLAQAQGRLLEAAAIDNERKAK